MTDKQLPHNLEAEKITLGVILVEQAQLHQVQELLKTEDFYLEAHRIIYQTICDMQRAETSIDVLTLKNELKRINKLSPAGGAPYLSSLTDGVAGATNVRHYARMVREASLLRETARLTETAMRRCMAGQDKAKDIIGDLQAKVLQLSMIGERKGPKRAADYISEAFKQIEDSATRKKVVVGLDTGFPKLNRITRGFHPGQLVILAARPGEGKTSWAGNIVDHVTAENKKTALFFSLEMSGRELAQRSICAMSPLDSHTIPQGNLNWNRISATCEKLLDAPLYIDDQAGLTIADLRARTHRVAARGPLDLIVVDYLQLMRGSGKKGENRDREISEITQGLKQLAKEVSCPVLALSQLNRDMEKAKKPRRPHLSDLRESGSIEQDADTVLFLWRDRKEDFANPRVFVAKNRSGPAGIDYEIEFDREYCRFRDLN